MLCYPFFFLHLITAQPYRAFEMKIVVHEKPGFLKIRYWQEFKYICIVFHFLICGYWCKLACFEDMNKSPLQVQYFKGNLYLHYYVKWPTLVLKCLFLVIRDKSRGFTLKANYFCLFEQFCGFIMLRKTRDFTAVFW